MSSTNAHASSSEANYLESLSDLFVGFLFIFIIFLMLFALLLAEAQSRTEEVATKLADAGALRNQMLTEIQEALKKRGIKIAIDPDTGIARLPESLLFASGVATLAASKKRNLQIVAQELSHILPCYSSGVHRSARCKSDSHPVLDAMLIEGHTDSDQFAGGEMDNYDLSAQRANATSQGLRFYAKSLAHLLNAHSQPLIGLSAYGPDRPIRSNATAEGRTANRRIDLRFIVGTPRNVDLRQAQHNGSLPL